MIYQLNVQMDNVHSMKLNVIKLKFLIHPLFVMMHSQLMFLIPVLTVLVHLINLNVIMQMDVLMKLHKNVHLEVVLILIFLHVILQHVQVLHLLNV